MLDADYGHGQQILQDSQPILTQLKTLSQSARMRFSPAAHDALTAAFAWSASAHDYVKKVAPEQYANFSRPIISDEWNNILRNIAALEQRIDRLLRIQADVAARRV